jgi:hypothetical protein
MTPRSILGLSTLIAVAALGCKKDDAGGEKPADETAPDTETAPDRSPGAGASDLPGGGGDNPFGVDLAGLASKLEGNWVVGGFMAGTKAAWKVEGNQVTFVEGDNEKTGELAIVAPCRLKVIEKDGSGGSSSTYSNFTFDGDKRWVGLGASGIEIGGKVFACVSNEIYVLAGGTCKKWQQAMFDKWEESEAECSVGDDGTLVAGSATLEKVGSAFVNSQMKGNEAKSFDDFEAAKAALAKE